MRQHKLIAYCYTNSLGSMREEDIRCLDAVHIAFGKIKNGEVYWIRENVKKDIERIRSLHEGIKIVLSIGGWAADGFSDAADSPESREHFASSAAMLLREENLDGLDIDWEYPCIDTAGIKAKKEDRDNFTLLLKELRRQLDAFEEYKSLSIAAGALPSYIAATNMEEAVRYLDYVQLMTYDFHGVFTETTGHLANLYESKAEPNAPDADKAVKLFIEAGVPADKIVMGAAFYSIQWTNVPNVDHGLAQKGILKEDYFPGYAQIDELAKTGKDGFERFFDEDAKAVYLYNGQDFISYEDKEALTYKADYVKKHSLYGMMYWEYSQDDSHAMTGFLYEELTKDNR